jgi:hypothetical protein
MILTFLCCGISPEVTGIPRYSNTILFGGGKRAQVMNLIASTSVWEAIYWRIAKEIAEI